MKKLTLVMMAFALMACSSSPKTTKGESTYDTEDSTITVSVELTDGKVAKVAIDETDGDTTKKALGADYGMVKASGIGKEWYEQIASLEESLIGTDGKIALDEKGYATDADVISGTTINLMGINAAVQEAIKNAK